ncbi:MAG TPA: hypothetical protein VIM85_09540 [Pseudomonadales bacterium]
MKKINFKTFPLYIVIAFFLTFSTAYAQDDESADTEYEEEGYAQEEMMLLSREECLQLAMQEEVPAEEQAAYIEACMSTNE